MGTIYRIIHYKEGSDLGTDIHKTTTFRQTELQSIFENLVRRLQPGESAEKRSTQYYEASHEGRDFLALGEPIKVGHHSEKRHRALIERNWNRMGKSVAESEKAEQHESKAEYWESKANTINLSMPESIEYFEYKVEKCKEYHEGLKSGKYPRLHGFTLTYAKKDLNEAEKNLITAKKLWA